MLNFTWNLISKSDFRETKSLISEEIKIKSFFSEANFSARDLPNHADAPTIMNVIILIV